MKNIVAFLFAFPLGYAIAGDAFDDASRFAYDIIGEVASSPICQPADISAFQRQRLSESLSSVTATGLSESTGLTPLHFSALANDPDRIDHFVSLGYSLDAQDLHGGTSLHTAAMSGAKESLLHLLAKGANPNIGNSIGATPLLVAASHNQEEIVLSLLAAGAMASTRTSADNTALHGALVCRNESLVQILLDSGAEIDALAENLSIEFGVPLPRNER